MIKIESKKNKSKVLLIAETDNDMDTLKFLFDSHVVFGFWKLYNYKEDKTRTIPEAKYMRLNFPLAVGMGFININSTYIPKEK